MNKKQFKAWIAEKELMENARPVILEEDEQGWLANKEVEKMEDALLKMKWSSAVPGSAAPERVIFGAVQDLENMGYDVSAPEALLEAGLAAHDCNDMLTLNRLTIRIWHLMNNAPKIASHPYWSYKQYHTFEDYLADVKFPEPHKYDKKSQKYAEDNYAGWLAQIIGGAVGTAVEGYTPEAILEKFGVIRDYVRKPNTYNDDITYEIAFLMALERYGKDLTSAGIAEEWVALIPFGWSAEEWALKNLKLGIYPPESGYLHNPYREWIGAQMRGAVCGMIAPGDYKKAAYYAFMDGVVSHHNNGVIGEVFNAMLVAGSYVEKDNKKLLETIINLIPKKSEYYSVVKFALDQCKAHKKWEDAWTKCRKKFERYNWIHAYPNAAAEVVALWYGNNDFTETISICCHCGYDVDCNVAQIATDLGIKAGVEAIAPHWKEPIGDLLITYLRKYEKLSIRELADFTTRLARKV